MTDPHVGKLVYFRVYGSLEKGDKYSTPPPAIKNASAGSCKCMPTTGEDRDDIQAGDIVAGIGLKNTRTGDTLCTPDKPIVLEQLTFPNQLSTWQLSLDQRGSRQIRQPSQLCPKKINIPVQTDEETGQTVISGMGELP